MNTKFFIVVVLYECALEESQTIRRLMCLRNEQVLLSDILIYDNSLKSQLSNQYKSCMFYYKHNAANGGVAAAYNYAISLGQIKKKEWMILFDQDTDISDNYFNELDKAIKENSNHKLFCPLVKCRGAIISPTYYLLEKSIKAKKIGSGILASKYFTVINSGLVIQLKELQHLGGYDEDLPLDFSDHNFFKKYKKVNKEFVLINATNLHDLSSEIDNQFESVLSRFKKYYKSVYIYSRKNKSFFPVIWFWIRTVKLTIKYNRLDFFKFICCKEQVSSI